MDLRLFGGLRFLAADGSGDEIDLGSPRQRLVLVLLAIEADRVVATDRLIELLWPAEHDKKLSSLQAYISNLRKAMNGRVSSRTQVVRQAPGYRLGIDRSAVDVLRFEDLVHAGRRSFEASQRADALATFIAALDLWTASPLPEFADESAVIHATARWHNLLGVALEGAAELLLDSGEEQAALLLLEQRIGEFPLRERLRSLAALGLYRAGRQTEALRLIDGTRQSLIESSGLDIGAELAELERRILAQDPTLQIREKPAAVRWPHPPTVESMLIGREAELAVLHRSLAAVTAGRGGVVTVTGPPGIGKSALVEHFADMVATTWPVAWTRSPPEMVAPPFWPLVQIETQLREAGAVSNDGPVAGEASQPDPFLFAQRLAAVLRGAKLQGAKLRGANGTAVVVIDDLQWADDDTLRVVAHLVGELRRTGILMVVTMHPLSASAGDAMLACASELARHRIADIGVSELTAADVGDWLTRHCGRRVPADIVSDLFARTGGNPLFVREVAELIAPGVAPHEVGGDDELRTTLTGVPPGLIAVVRRRVGHLPGAVQQMLTAAAVLGGSGDVSVLADVVGVTAEQALATLGIASATGLVSIDPLTNGYQFSHGVVSQALSVEVVDSRRADIHSAAARSLARRQPDDRHAALVAHHAAAGSVAGTSALAIDASTRAARFAEVRGASVDAAQHWRVVVSMLERFRPDDRAVRLDALIAAARAHERADQMSEAQQLVITALDLGRIDDDPALVERAVSVLNHVSIYPNQAYGEINTVLIALLAHCLQALPAASTTARATVLSALATELFHSDDVEWRDRVSGEALAIARHAGAPAVLARVLHARTFALKAPTTTQARRAAAVELAELASSHSLGDDIRLMAQHHIVLADCSLGDLVASNDRMTSYLGMLDRPVNQALRSQIGFFRSLIGMMQGRYAESATHFEAAFDLFRRSRPTEAESYRLGRILTVGHDLGGIPEHCLDMARVDEVDGYRLAWTLYTSVILFELQRPEEARARLPYGAGTVPARPEDYTTVFIDTAAAIIAAETNDQLAAEQLLMRLEPMAGRWAAGGSAALSLGLVDLALARLYATIGDEQRAETWFASAVARHQRNATPSWLARSLLHQARFWLSTNGDATAAAAVLDRAATIASTFGLAPVAAQIERARTS